MSKKCKKDQIINPETNRCVKKDGKLGQKILQKLMSGELKSPVKKPKKKTETNKDGKILNPATGKYVKVDGKIGKAILAENKIEKSEGHIADKLPPKLYVDLVNGKKYEIPPEFYGKYTGAKLLEKLKKYNKEKEEQYKLEFQKQIKQIREDAKKKQDKKNNNAGNKWKKDILSVIEYWKKQPDSKKKRETIKEYTAWLNGEFNDKKQTKKEMEDELRELQKKKKEMEKIRKEVEAHRLKMLDYEEDEDGEKKERKGKLKQGTKKDLEKLLKNLDTKEIDDTIKKIDGWYHNLKVDTKTIKFIVNQIANDHLILKEDYIDQIYNNFKSRVKTRLVKYLTEKGEYKEEKEGKGGENKKLSKKELEELVNGIVKKKLSKDTVCSSWDIEYIMKNGKLKGKYNKDDLEKILKNLKKENKIYETGNKKSYISIVKNNGYISCQEENMIKRIKENKDTYFEDTEFPIDKKGRYIVNEEKKVKEEKKSDKEGKKDEKLWLFDNFEDRYKFRDYVRKMLKSELVQFIKKYNAIELFIQDKKDNINDHNKKDLEEGIVDWWSDFKDVKPKKRKFEKENVEEKKDEPISLKLKIGSKKEKPQVICNGDICYLADKNGNKIGGKKKEDEPLSFKVKITPKKKKNDEPLSLKVKLGSKKKS